MRINVQRAFLLKGVRQEVGTTVDVVDSLARELIGAQKATPAAVLKAPAGPMTTTSTAAIVPGAAAVKTAKKDDK